MTEKPAPEDLRLHGLASCDGFPIRGRSGAQPSAHERAPELQIQADFDGYRAGFRLQIDDAIKQSLDVPLPAGTR